MDLSKVVKSVQILNIDEAESTISPELLPAFDTHKDSKKFIVSDVDEELLILIEFSQIIDLRSIRVHALPLDGDSIEDASPPRQVHAFKIKHANYNFDDFQNQALKPDKSLQCSAKKLAKGQLLKLKAPKFKRLKFLALFIDSNQEGTEKTYLNGISMKGQFDDALNEQKGDGDDDVATTLRLRKIEDVNQETAFHQLDRLSAKELTQFLQSHGIDPKAAPYHCVEKADLVRLALKIQKQVKGKSVQKEEKTDD